jgi:HSP20 family protein
MSGGAVSEEVPLPQPKEYQMSTREVVKNGGSATQRPLDFMHAIRDEMDRVFERFEHGWSRWPTALARGFRGGMFVPEVDVRDNGKQLMIDVDLPGVDEQDVSVTFANGLLTVKGEKKTEREETKDNYYTAERSCGAFERSLELPDTIDESKIEARFDKGVLKIVAQKKPEAAKAERRIEIKKS